MTQKMPKKFHQKRQARKIVFSALYAARVTGGKIDLQVVEQQLNEDESSDIDYAKTLLTSYETHQETVAQLISDACNHKARSGNTDVERAILEMATAELIAATVPKKVAINEAIEIAKIYGAEDGYKYINGVMDRIAKQIT